MDRNQANSGEEEKDRKKRIETPAREKYSSLCIGILVMAKSRASD